MVLRDYHCEACGHLWEDLEVPICCASCGQADRVVKVFSAPKLGGFAADRIRGRARNASNSPRISVTVPEKITK